MFLVIFFEYVYMPTLYYKINLSWNARVLVWFKTNKQDLRNVK